MADGPTLSAELAGLFPRGVVAAECRQTVSIELLTAQEHAAIRHAALKRIQDFAAGRACARIALRQLGIESFSLLAGARRQPLWPTGIVGSITHTAGFSAAVVARQHDLCAVGLDCEEIDAVNEEVWTGICTAAELDLLATLPELQRRRRAGLIFAAKEAFYKFQFPLTNQWVGFEDVTVAVTDHTFDIIPVRGVPLAQEITVRMQGRYRFFDRWVIAALGAVA